MIDSNFPSELLPHIRTSIAIETSVKRETASEVAMLLQRPQNKFINKYLRGKIILQNTSNIFLIMYNKGDRDIKIRDMTFDLWNF